jgi:coatomer protein complex subunit epsilon
MTDTVDELYDVKTAYYIGAFAQCINTAQKAKVGTNDDLKLERDCYVYRSYVNQKKYGVIFDEIRENTSEAALKAIRLYAGFMNNINSEDALSSAVSSFEQLFSGIDPQSKMAWLPSVLLASCYYHKGDTDGAMRALSGAVSDSLEIKALMIQCLLSIDRVDLARKEMRKMQELDEDATLTQLASAWCSLFVGGEKLQDSYYTFQELADKTKSTSLLLNGMAAAYLGQNKQDEADGVISESQQLDDNCAETLVNAIKNRFLAGRGIESGTRFLSELKSNHSNHLYMKDFAEKEAQFDMLAAQYAEAQ